MNPPVAGRYTVTAYCPCKKCCGRFADGVTASGDPVTVNGGKFVAADPSIPLRTFVSVDGYNGGRPVPVLDRGGAIKGRRIDCFFPTHKEALEFGIRRGVEVRIFPPRKTRNPRNEKPADKS